MQRTACDRTTIHTLSAYGEMSKRQEHVYIWHRRNRVQMRRRGDALKHIMVGLDSNMMDEIERQEARCV